ncbi:RlpA-like double-psi beta-barrel domain-containing protein [Streptomyces sp. SL13]|uniref:RlpA-like double-psi beta-barrel domain-containing protein n=1 Tax=Streptantibioticus silvisoli TaxID=2705255 RepID=A0AA90K0Q6_9ACTN|nr:RlpA-like double-psi beta-barrel domain-containing protein [Streptantibioticus silvisoli]MDI5973241.1 RlpA-like double-psi beta-barrel domain-containing protein [Streptantibioticus silvisoli]
MRTAGRALGVLAGAAAMSGLALVPANSASAVGIATTGRHAAPHAVPHDDTCWATHYGQGIPPGSFTASGDVFDDSAMAAATSLSLDPQLPFGTMVKVTNTANNASVTVRINDRGTFTSPVCLDLTDGAFSQLAALDPDPGHIVVTEQVVSGGGTTPPGDPDCATPWSSSAVYVAGDTASDAGHDWQAKWWTTGEDPTTSGPSGVWQDLGPC